MPGLQTVPQGNYSLGQLNLNQPPVMVQGSGTIKVLSQNAAGQVSVLRELQGLQIPHQLVAQISKSFV